MDFWGQACSTEWLFFIICSLFSLLAFCWLRESGTWAHIVKKWCSCWGKPRALTTMRRIDYVECECSKLDLGWLSQTCENHPTLGSYANCVFFVVLKITTSSRWPCSLILLFFYSFVFLLLPLLLPKCILKVTRIRTTKAVHEHMILQPRQWQQYNSVSIPLMGETRNSPISQFPWQIANGIFWEKFGWP